MVINHLNQEQVSASFDTDRSIAMITYRGVLSATESAAAYGWLERLIDKIGIEALRGEIFDFREVTTFTTENLIDARRHSRKMNIVHDTNHFPVALVVATSMQEEMLRGPMRNVQGNKRKGLVRSIDDALDFIDEWNVQHGR